jgi:DNA-binding MarR family transcriptional regulator
VPEGNCQLSSQFANISLVLPDTDESDVPSTPLSLGAALRRAWLGYQLRLDRAMAEAGFGERRFPDGRALRMCSGDEGSTISAIGRELGITRQGASKVVVHLRERGYVAVADSTTSKREKSVMLTQRGIDYLAHQRAAVRAIEDELQAELGEAALRALGALLDTLDAGEGARLRAYLRRSSNI